MSTNSDDSTKSEKRKYLNKENHLPRKTFEVALETSEAEDFVTLTKDEWQKLNKWLLDSSLSEKKIPYKDLPYTAQIVARDWIAVKRAGRLKR